jgi:hypothetical protein
VIGFDLDVRLVALLRESWARRMATPESFAALFRPETPGDYISRLRDYFTGAPLNVIEAHQLRNAARLVGTPGALPLITVGLLGESPTLEYADQGVGLLGARGAHHEQEAEVRVWSASSDVCRVLYAWARGELYARQLDLIASGLESVLFRRGGPVVLDPDLASEAPAVYSRAQVWAALLPVEVPLAGVVVGPPVSWSVGLAQSGGLVVAEG